MGACLAVSAPDKMRYHILQYIGLYITHPVERT